MDSISGHSEENLEDKYKKLFEHIKQNGEIKKISIEDLPFNEQEELRGIMEMMGMENPPEIFAIDFVINDMNILPTKELLNIFVNSLKNDKFELAEEISGIFKKRNFSIDISDNSVSLTYNKKE